MVGRITLLDCTLRDGGYVNDWEFGNGNMISIYDRLNQSGVEVIEIGFLDDRRPEDMNRSIQPNTAAMTRAYSKGMERKSTIVAMIDYGTCSLDNLQPQSETTIDGIRVIFKKNNMHKAVEFGKGVIAKGYKLFLQMVSITSYEDDDVKEFCDHVNETTPFGVSIVDTYGLMHKEQVFHYFELLDKYLKKDISIGYHSHNNFQLAYSNTIEMLGLKTDRDVIVDGTLYGMGKSAGNAPIELLSMYLNDNMGKSYDINQMLEAIDVNIMPIYEKHYWGYSLFFYLAAKNDCHPNYVKYLMDKRSLSVKDINVILDKISPELKLKYDADHIESIYSEYLLGTVKSDDESLGKLFGSRPILVIGPGKSVADRCGDIREFIKEKDPLTVAVNFIPSGIDADYIFFSNPKRYSLMMPKMKGCGSKIIATSNITPASDPFDYVVRYDGLISESGEIWDNALVIFINLLRCHGIKSITLAGFDGFEGSVEENYIGKEFDLSKDQNYLSAVNRLLTEKISEYRSEMDIVFLTPSKYDRV